MRMLTLGGEGSILLLLMLVVTCLVSAGVGTLLFYVSIVSLWSRRQPLADIGAVLYLRDGPQGSDPAFCLVWFRFRMSRRNLACRPGEVPGAHRLLDSVAEGCPGLGLVHLLVDSAAEVGFQSDSRRHGWERPGLSVLSNLAGPIQHFRVAG